MVVPVAGVVVGMVVRWLVMGIVVRMVRGDAVLSSRRVEGGRVTAAVRPSGDSRRRTRQQGGGLVVAVRVVCVVCVGETRYRRTAWGGLGRGTFILGE